MGVSFSDANDTVAGARLRWTTLNTRLLFLLGHLYWSGVRVRCGHVFERNWSMCSEYDNHPRLTKLGETYVMLCYIIV
jgi:hypothetical protein